MIHINIDPVLWQWGPLTLTWHGIFLTLGVIACYQVALREGRRMGIPRDVFAELMIWLAIFGYLGARLFHVVQFWDQYARQPLKILAFYQGGLTVYGVLFGGIMAAVVYAWRKKIPFWRMIDAFAPGIILGEIVGRVGCTINGDVWGLPTHGAWGLVYDHPAALLPSSLLGMPTVPAPTLLQLWNAGVLALLLVLRRRPLRPGVLFVTAVMLYAVGRFVVNFWQYDPLFLFGLKQAQVVSVGAVLAGTALLLIWRRQAPLRR